MLIRDLMTAPAVTVHAETPIGTALRMLDTTKITAMPVVDKAGTIVGIVSEADLIQDAALLESRAPIAAVATTTDPPPRRVVDVMSYLVATVRPDQELETAVELMWSTMTKSLPVVEHGEVVGMISRSDIIHLLAGRDERIQAQVKELVEAESPAWQVSVHDGVVTVTGPADEHERKIAKILASAAPGVVAVRIH
jgi:CBS-domain-containing membrane protein